MTFKAFDDSSGNDQGYYPKRAASDADFKRLDLSSERLLGIDMVGADLSHAILSSSLIAGANFEGANLSGASLVRATLAGVNLRKANLANADLSESKWISVDVRDADFGDAVMDGAKSVRVNWSSATTPPERKPGPMVTPFVFMPLILVGGLILSLLLRWRYRKES
ncbi:MAG: pentapeptide repeat-containing protein [Candidatus Promineifilaceae bacterium]|jgi:uncharacterized protein YjbI with pentapeptide repeats